MDSILSYTEPRTLKIRWMLLWLMQPCILISAVAYWRPTRTSQTLASYITMPVINNLIEYY